jgi:tellurium resistance protein TerD
MSISLSKEESIKKINLRKDTFVSLTKYNPVLNNLTSRVAVVLDYSWSMKSYYMSGEIQTVLEKLMPLALQFDDNGALDFWIFEGGFTRLGEITLDNFYGFVDNEVLARYKMGGTNYAPVMKDVFSKYVIEEPVEYPSYVIFITDGDCYDTDEAIECIKRYAEYNIFWQFVGIGNTGFDTLEKLDDLTDRVIDNADFFKVGNLATMSEDELYKKLMNEYPGYLTEATNKGIIKLKNNNVKGEKKTMAVSLSKGGKVSLAKVAADAGINNLSKVVVGLGWDCQKYDGGHDFDLDAAAFLTGASGKVRSEDDFIFYNRTSDIGSFGGNGKWIPDLDKSSIIHTGDNRTGEGEGDDEQIKVDLTAIPADVEKVSFTVTIDQADSRGQNFGMVENAYIHIIDEATGTELIRYDLTEDFSVETAIVAAELYRHGGEWKFNAVGAGFSGGLAALCKNFGIDAE